eukprot:14638674-Alexandrium_andersonii.AAC.1
MSASLVGSEMCIRDRIVGASRRASKLKPSGMGHQHHAAEPQLRRPAVAVSYTHLTLPTICSV